MISSRVLDHDTYSAHDAIGKVYIDLDPLLSKENTCVFSGWFPIYDTMHGKLMLIGNMRWFVLIAMLIYAIFHLGNLKIFLCAYFQSGMNMCVPCGD